MEEDNRDMPRILNNGVRNELQKFVDFDHLEHVRAVERLPGRLKVDCRGFKSGNGRPLNLSLRQVTL